MSEVRKLYWNNHNILNWCENFEGFFYIPDLLWKEIWFYLTVSVLTQKHDLLLGEKKNFHTMKKFQIVMHHSL